MVNEARSSFPGFIPGPRRFARYLYSIWPSIAVVVSLFLLSSAAGYMVPVASPELSGTLLAGLQDKAESITSQAPPLVMLGIFANNATAALAAVLFGLVAGLFPVFFVISNGLIIGIMLETVVAKLGILGGTVAFAAGILPHGVLELPAVLISTAIGLDLGYRVLRTLVKGDGRVADRLKDGLLVFIFWIVPALFVAAIIETFVTGAILSYFVQAPII